MFRATTQLAVGCASLAVLLAGCTGSASSPSPLPSTAQRSSPTPSGPPPLSTTPTPAGDRRCSHADTRLTFHQRVVVVGGRKIVVPPGGKRTPRIPDTFSRVLHASAPGLGTHSGLIHMIDRRWHTSAAELGRSSGRSGGSARISQPKKTTRPRALAQYDTFTVYSGTYSSRCGGQVVTGRYQTFGRQSEVEKWCFPTKDANVRRLCH